MSETDPRRVELTRLLNRAATGDRDAADLLMPLIYDELRRIARAQLRSERTISPTELVHESWLRLDSADGGSWESRSHFFGAAARAMRRILVEQHRRRRSLKRGGDRQREELSTGIETPQHVSSVDMVALDEALDRLAGEHPRPAEVVMLRYFAGVSLHDISHMLSVSRRTVEREWYFARIWLKRALQ